MAAVANITEQGNLITIGNALAKVMAPSLKKSVCMTNLMTTEDLPEGALTKKFMLSGSFTAATLVEATALAADANGELTDTSVTATVAKAAVVTGVSAEASGFGGLTLDRVATEHGAAIARFVDDDALALFSGLSTAVTSTTVLTVDDMMLGQFNIYNSECPNKEITLASVLHPKAHYNVKKEIVQAGAANWTNQTRLAILETNPQANCFVGNIPGLADVYATTGQGTSGGDTVDAIFHPVWTFAGVFAPAPQSWISPKGSEGFYNEVATLFFYDVLEYNDGCGVKLLSDT